MSSSFRLGQGETKEISHNKSDLLDQFPDSKTPMQNNRILIHSCYIPTPQRLALKHTHTRLVSSMLLPTASLHKSASLLVE